MKHNPERWLRLPLFLLILLLAWSIHGIAQAPPAATTEPAAAAAAAPAPAATPATAETARGLLPAFGDPGHDYLTFGLHRIEFLSRHSLFGQPLWKYIASLIYIYLAFLISKFLDFLTRVWLKKWTARTATNLDDLFLDLLNGPVKVVSFVIFLHIGLNIFAWPTWIEQIFSRGLQIVVACSLTYLILKIVDLLFNYWRSKAAHDDDKSFDEQLLPILKKSIKAFVVIVAILVTCQNMGINITGVIASLSIGGLALGLAAQDTLANLFGAVAVFLDKPFRIGDRIKLDAVDGVVESIGLRSTRVRNLDGHLITIPNKTMGNATITNVTRRPFLKTEMNLGLTYDTSNEKLRAAVAILESTYKAHPKTQDLQVAFNRFADSSLNIQVVHWWDGLDWKEYLAGMQEFNLRIKQAFEEQGIEFAFPTQTLHVVRQDPEPPPQA